MPDYEKLIKLLTKHRVEFVLIGGFAAIIHGSSLLTEDVDVCIPFSVENCRRLLKALKNCHPIHRQNKLHLKETASSLTKYKNLYLITDLGLIDFLGEVIELGKFKDLKTHTTKMELFGQKVRVLNIESLIRSKKAMGRFKDKHVVLELKAILEKTKK